MSLIKIKFFILVFVSLPNLCVTEPLELTDKTWKDMLCGQWMVEFYAPWCPSCQNFKSVWNDFSKAMMPKEIKVAAVDINQYPSLSGRFRISVLPTIYYVRDGVFRQFNGERSLDGLKNYIEYQEWRRTDPVTTWFSPDSLIMSMISSIFDVSVLVKDAYTVLQDEYGWPSWLIYIVFSLIVIAVGLLLGFGVLMLIDYCLTGTSKDDLNNIPDDSKDAEDLDDFESQKSLKPQRPIKSNIVFPKLVTTSTPQRSTIKNRFTMKTEDQNEPLLTNDFRTEIQNDENEELDAVNEEDQTTSSKLRHRQKND